MPHRLPVVTRAPDVLAGAPARHCANADAGAGGGRTNAHALVTPALLTPRSNAAAVVVAVVRHAALQFRLPGRRRCCCGPSDPSAAGAIVVTKRASLRVVVLVAVCVGGVGWSAGWGEAREVNLGSSPVVYGNNLCDESAARGALGAGFGAAPCTRFSCFRPWAVPGGCGGPSRALGVAKRVVQAPH